MITQDDLSTEEYEISSVDNKGSEPRFIIPQRFRKMENLHIIFWLIMDISWCMVWQKLGLAMILPTLFIGIMITVRTRRYTSELCHNLAVVFWIIARSYWMICEFYTFDSLPLGYQDFSYKDLTAIPFAMGIITLAFYYIWWKPRHKEHVETML